MICEDCAIEDYRTKFGFASKETAEARRRRMFDVGYLLQEMIIDRYLEQNKMNDYGKLDLSTMQFLGDLSHRIYNENLSREEKWELENEPDQRKIELKLEKVVESIE